MFSALSSLRSELSSLGLEVSSFLLSSSIMRMVSADNIGRNPFQI
nr:MAG TPA: hypothetical protein [Bacteriophage sp.]